MVFLFSGFGASFCQNLSVFADHLGPHKRTVLVLQGGEGHEEFLPQYLDAFASAGISVAAIIVPDSSTGMLAEGHLAQLEQAEGVFIGGGSTRRYWDLYCTPEAARVFRSLRESGIAIAGLSAGAKILGTSVFLDGGLEEHRGLGLVPFTQIIPHFDDGYQAYEAVRFGLQHPCRRAIALETDCMLQVDAGADIVQHGPACSYWVEGRGKGNVALTCNEESPTLARPHLHDA